MDMIVKFEGKTPIIDDSALVMENATIVGDVTISKDCSIWYSAVLRGDEAKIFIGERTNVQDNATIHSDNGIPVNVGSDVTIGHNAIVHSCTIGNKTVVGMGSVVLNEAIIGEGSVIAAGAVVMARMIVPPYSMVAGTPAVIKKVYGSEIADKNEENAQEYVRLISKYRESGR